MQLHGDSIHWITYRCHQLLIFSAMRYQHSMMALTGFIVPADISRIYQLINCTFPRSDQPVSRRRQRYDAMLCDGCPTVVRMWGSYISAEAVFAQQSEHF